MSKFIGSVCIFLFFTTLVGLAATIVPSYSASVAPWYIDVIFTLGVLLVPTLFIICGVMLIFEEYELRKSLTGAICVLLFLFVIKPLWPIIYTETGNINIMFDVGYYAALTYFVPILMSLWLLANFSTFEKHRSEENEEIEN